MELIGADLDSLLYFLTHRLGIIEQRVGLTVSRPLALALYLEAFALGRRFEQRHPTP